MQFLTSINHRGNGSLMEDPMQPPPRSFIIRARSVLRASFCVCALAATANAHATAFLLSTDDYGVLRINGATIAAYDDYPWGNATGSVSLPGGWYPFELTYKNRYGSTGLYLYQRPVSSDPWNLVPLSSFRYTSPTGTISPGLRGDYYTLSGAYLGTTFGEGPIAHGWNNQYNGRGGQWGNGLVDTNWGQFEERITGEIRIAGNQPSLLTLAKLARDAYSPVAYGADGYSLVDTVVRNGFNANAYKNGDQVVISVRGTELNSGYFTSIKNLIADQSFASGVPTSQVANYASVGAEFLERVVRANPGVTVTFTGHSLGGAVAQLLAQASGRRGDVFNAPGAALLAPALAPNLARASAVSTGETATLTSIRMYGDAVSLVGRPMGTVMTLAPPANIPKTVIDAAPEAYALSMHDKNLLVTQLESGVIPVTGRALE